MSAPPSVRITDASGVRLAGVEVDFEVLEGGGSVGATSTSTSATGIATTSWRLGSAGAQRLRVTCPTLPGMALEFHAEAFAASDGYQVDLRFLTDATEAQWTAFTAAAARIGEVVTGDVSPVTLGSPFQCGGDTVTGDVDDLLILVRIHVIDGVGGILGQAGPCAVRAGTRIPVLGVMEFDAADLEQMEARGTLGPVILHEMLHVVGFGTTWEDPAPSLVSGAGTSSPAFTGAQALGAAKGSNGAPAGWTSVPLENCGSASPSPCGSGTRDSHWLEPVFGDELMTGWISGSVDPLSRTTVASLADLGYSVDLDAADPFDLTAGSVAHTIRAGSRVHLENDVLRLPIQEVEPHSADLRP